jgi:hypothetical protein
MANESTTPVVILAFSNDRDDYLQMIVRERKAIARALQDYDDKGYIKVVKEENTSIADVFDLCTRYANRVAIFHYGGHASGTQLQLEAAGQADLANAVGLPPRYRSTTRSPPSLRNSSIRRLAATPRSSPPSSWPRRSSPRNTARPASWVSSVR